MVRAVYSPQDQNQFTRGHLVDEDGNRIQAVVLGRVITLMQRHLALDDPHLWIVYPRCRGNGRLHLQIVGIWEPSTLDKSRSLNQAETSKTSDDDRLPEGENYFSIRGELIFTKPETENLIIKIRQQFSKDGRKPASFKIHLKGNIPLKNLRHFVSLEAYRSEDQICLDNYHVVAPLPNVAKGQKNKEIGKEKVKRNEKKNS